MAQRSPFTRFENFSAQFQVQGSGLTVDAKGNTVPVKQWVRVRAKMSQVSAEVAERSASRTIADFGLEASRASFLRGHVIAPLPVTKGGDTLLDTLIDWRTPCLAVFDGKVGRFYWDQQLRNPYLKGVGVDIVRRFQGYWVEGASLTIEGTERLV